MDCWAFILLPTLRQIASVRLAAAIWAKDDIRALISAFSFAPSAKRKKFGFDEKDARWQEIEESVIEYVRSAKYLPETMKRNLFHAINAVGNQIRLWWKYHTYKNELVTQLPKEFCWTVRGAIDLKRTAEILVEHPDLHAVARYKLSCIFCFVDKIEDSWKQLPSPCKKYYCGKIKSREKLVNFWTFRLHNTLDDLLEGTGITCPNTYAFYCATKSGNLAATQHFIELLNPGEMERALVSCASEFSNEDASADFPLEFRNDVVFYLLSRMNRSQQLATLKNCLLYTLMRSLDWPWQNLFITMVTRLMGLVSEHDFQMLAGLIVQKVEKGSTDFDYGQLFAEFWASGSDNFRCSALGNKCSWRFVRVFVMNEELECFNLVLNAMSCTDKEGLIFDCVGMDTCERLMDAGRWNLLGFFVNSCLPTQRKLREFRAAYAERNRKMYGNESSSVRVERLQMKHKQFEYVLDGYLRNLIG